LFVVYCVRYSGISEFRIFMPGIPLHMFSFAICERGEKRVEKSALVISGLELEAFSTEV
jgi:hypothetical protein